MRGALVAGEVAVAVVLVVGAGLMVRSVLNLMNGRRGIRAVAARDSAPGA